MARSFISVKVISAVVADGFSNSLTRRGYAAAAQSATRGVASSSISGKIVAPKSGEDKVAAGEKVAWVPDPVTGYYKPENMKEIDVAELRATVLGKNITTKILRTALAGDLNIMAPLGVSQVFSGIIIDDVLVLLLSCFEN